MSHIDTPLSDPEAVERYRVVVETVLLVVGPLTEPMRGYLEQRADELDIHRLDAEQVLAEVQSLPSVRIALGIVAAQRGQAKHDHEDAIADRVANRHFRAALTEQLNAEREQREALTEQVKRDQALIEQLQQQFVAIEEQLRHVPVAIAPVASASPVEAALPVEAPSATSSSPSPRQFGLERPAATTKSPQAVVAVVTEPVPVPAVTVTEPPLMLDGAAMVLIPAGEFTRGSEEGDDDQPMCSIYLDAYYINKYPITVRQYKQFCEGTGTSMLPEPMGSIWNGRSWNVGSWNPGWSKEDHPMIGLNWDDANAYCNWLSQEGGMRVTLPTEAQWEKAARGTDGRRFPWGENFEQDRLWGSVPSQRYDGPTSVTRREFMNTSPYGVLNMAGNVYDWCADWYGETYYEVAPRQNPTGPSWGTKRVIRGGSWNDNKEAMFRCASRDSRLPETRENYLGFRYVVLL